MNEPIETALVRILVEAILSPEVRFPLCFSHVI